MRSAFGGRNERLNTSPTAGFAAARRRDYRLDGVGHARVLDVADAELRASGVMIKVFDHVQRGAVSRCPCSAAAPWRRAGDRGIGIGHHLAHRFGDGAHQTLDRLGLVLGELPDTITPLE